MPLGALVYLLLLSLLIAAMRGGVWRARTALRVHYLPLLAWLFMVGFVEAGVGTAEMRWRPLTSFMWGWVSPLTALAFVLAPFVIVGRGLGAWTGFKTGLRLLWWERWPLLGVFVCFRIAFEVLNIAGLMLPTDRGWGLGPTPWPLLVERGAMTLLFGLLAMWLATAFMMLVTERKPDAAVDAQATA
jgi:hypothetical protein